MKSIYLWASNVLGGACVAAILLALAGNVLADPPGDGGGEGGGTKPPVCTSCAKADIPSTGGCTSCSAVADQGLCFLTESSGFCTGNNASCETACKCQWSAAWVCK